MAKRTTIKDIADKAGVSIGSVHCALAGKPGVGEETRLRILEVAQELDYRPNAVASALKRKTVRIAAVFPGPREDNRFYYTYVWEGVRDYFRTVGDFNVELVEAPYYTYIDDPSDELNRLLEQGGIDGLLTVGYMEGRSKLALQKIIQQEIPTILVGGDIPQFERLCCVQPNYQIIGRTMAELLVSQSPANSGILVCAGDVINPSHYEIVQGMDDYIREKQLKNTLYKIQAGKMTEDVYSHILYTFEKNADIAACCSVNARGSVLLARALQERGLARKISAIGSDLFDENMQALRDGVFTNLVNKNPYSQSYLAARYMVDYLLRDIRPGQTPVFVGSEMVFQSSLPMYENGSYRLLL